MGFGVWGLGFRVMNPKDSLTHTHTHTQTLTTQTHTHGTPYIYIYIYIYIGEKWSAAGAAGGAHVARKPLQTAVFALRSLLTLIRSL